MRLYESSDPALEVAGLRIVQVLATTTGGTGAHVRLLTSHLLAAGARVVVCAPQPALDAFDFAGLGAGVLPVPIGSLPHPRDVVTARSLRQAVAEADVVHAHGLRAGTLAGLATRRDVPFVLTRHNLILARGPVAHLHRTLERYTARRADVTMCVSSDLVEAVRSAGGADVRRTFVTAPPMRGANRTREQVREELRLGPAPLVLAVGRLHPQKDYPTLIEAAHLLVDLEPRPLFAIAGDGPQRAELAALIERRAAPVRLLGERTDVPELLLAADLLVQTSIWEAGSLAVQEGLRTGLPFVGTCVGAIPDLVADAGLLVRPRDARALAAQVRRVLTEPGVERDLRDRARRRAKALPDDTDVVAQVVAAYSGARETQRRAGR